MHWLQTKIADSATISTGIPFRTRLRHHPGAPVAVIQPRDISGAPTVDLQTATRMESLPSSHQPTLMSGDVLLQPRGYTFAAAMLGHAPGLVAAAAPLLVIRCDATRLLPEYLTMFLALPRTQARLRNEAAGTHIPQVPRSAVAQLMIDLPDLPHQRQLVQLARMHREEAALTTRLARIRQQLIQLAIRNLAGPVHIAAGAPQPN